MSNKTQDDLLYKAQYQAEVQHHAIENRKQYLGKLEDKERNQERNIHGIVQYAKKIRAELEDYKNKVEMSEKIVKDLQESGNDSVDNLLGMLRKYKRQQKNCKDEIEKLNHLDVVKAAEIADLN